MPGCWTSRRRRTASSLTPHVTLGLRSLRERVSACDSLRIHEPHELKPSGALGRHATELEAPAVLLPDIDDAGGMLTAERDGHDVILWIAPEREAESAPAGPLRMVNEHGPAVDEERLTRDRRCIKGTTMKRDRRHCGDMLITTHHDTEISVSFGHGKCRLGVVRAG